MIIFSEPILKTVAIGLGATVAMDFWRLFLEKAFGISSLDLGLLGRWVGHLFHGRVFHRPITKSPRVTGEIALGWLTHYTIGLAFAGLLPLFWGEGWLECPSLWPALAIGLGTVLAPWFALQPAMGLGIAAARAPAPNSVRLRNIAIHSVYGLGLFASAMVVQWSG